MHRRVPPAGIEPASHFRKPRHSLAARLAPPFYALPTSTPRPLARISVSLTKCVTAWLSRIAAYFGHGHHVVDDPCIAYYESSSSAIEAIATHLVGTDEAAKIRTVIEGWPRRHEGQSRRCMC